MTRSYWQARRESRKPNAPAPATLGPLDFVVVGGGLLGCSIAYWLRRARPDARIAVLERARVGHGASGRNAGFVLQGSASNYATDVERFGRTVARDLWAETLVCRHAMFEELSTGVFAGAPTGARTVAGTPAEDGALRASAELLLEDGFDAAYEDAAQTKAALGSNGFLGSLVVHSGAMVDPLALVHAIAEASESPVIDDCEVTGVSRGPDGVEISTSRGPVTAGRAVLALGAYLPLVVPELGRYVRPVRAQMLATVPIAEAAFAQPVYSHRGYFYARQSPAGAVLAGGARHLHEEVEVGYEDVVTAEVQSDLEAYLGRHFPGLAGLAVDRRWSGTMGFSPDHLPVVGEVPGVAGCTYVTGLTGHGLSIGFRLAELIAGALTDSARPVGLDPFDAGRFDEDVAA